jgi:acyl-ACP thioesterase
MDPVGRIPLPPTPPHAVHHRFAVRAHELEPMDHANNAVYLDWLEEGILDDPAGAGAATLGAVPRRYRMEFVLAVEAGAQLDGAAWRDDDGWSYRLAGSDGGSDRFRARVSIGSGAADRREEES